MKFLKIVLLFLIILPATFAQTQCEISGDNTSWASVTSTRYGGDMDSAYDFAHAQNLDEGETYYARCKNATTEWGYISFKTEDPVQEESMSAGIILGSVGLIFLFAYLFIKTDNGSALKVLYFNMIFLFVMTSGYLFNGFAEYAGLSSSIIVVTHWMFVVSMIIFVFILLYTMYQLVTQLLRHRKMKYEQNQVGENW